jgi:membrane protein required for colicin V production
MAIIDLFILIPLIYGGYIGFKKGLIIEIASLVALAAGVYLGMKFSDLISEWINAAMDNPSPYVNLIAFSIVFLGVIILVFFFAKILERGINLALLSPLNKILGAVFGTAKLALGVGIILIIMDGYSEQSTQFIESQREDSLLYEPFTEMAKSVVPEFDYGIISTSSK